MHNFTPLASLLGGMLIGLSAAAMLLLDGKIAGISGILAGVLKPVKGDTLWRLCFLAGLARGRIAAQEHASRRVRLRPRSTRSLCWPSRALLVGFGTRLGSGCTSGHGICGMSRLSPRSLVATATFMFTGALVVYLLNHLAGGSAMKALLTSFLSGIVFALGLGISGMTRPIKVIGFLDFFGAWDASLAFVMIGAIAVYFVAYRLEQKNAITIVGGAFSLPRRSDLDTKLILGAAIFGAGWGLGGFCPGPAMTSLASGAPAVLIFVAAMAVGMFAHTWLAESRATTSDLGGGVVENIQDA